MDRDDLKKYGKWTLIIFSIVEVFAILVCLPIFHDSSRLLPIFWMVTGFFISIGCGTFFVGKIREFFANDIKKHFRGKVEEELGELIIPELDDKIPSCHLDWLMGVIERFVFTVFVTVSFKNAIAPMGAWIALKLAASWRRRTVENKPYELLLIRLLTLNALMNSFISICFAVLGGFVTRIGIRLIWPNFPDICWGNLLSLIC